MTDGNYRRLGAACAANGCSNDPIGRYKGGDPLCNMHSLRMRKHGSLDLPARTPKAPLKPCGVDGCEGLANRVGAGLCELHYMRVRRHGDTDKKSLVKDGALVHSHGYLLDYAPDHPLSRSGPRVYQHRAVFYAAHGDGPFKCNWCGKVVTWDDMHVDHVDADKQNNAESNLVASCAICNQKRGKDAFMAAMRARHGITMDGVRKTMREWADSLGISRNSLAARLSAGWDVRRALTEPRGPTGPRRRSASEAIQPVDRTAHGESRAALFERRAAPSGAC